MYPKHRKISSGKVRTQIRPATAQPRRRAQMYAKHEEKHTARLKCIPNTEKYQAKNFSPRSGQLPHSHIGELKCMQNTRESTLPDSNVSKTPNKNVRRRSLHPDPASHRTGLMCVIDENANEDEERGGAADGRRCPRKTRTPHKGCGE